MGIYLEREDLHTAGMRMLLVHLPMPSPSPITPSSQTSFFHDDYCTSIKYYEDCLSVVRASHIQHPKLKTALG
jgi:hypothetical protein